MNAVPVDEGLKFRGTNGHAAAAAACPVGKFGPRSAIRIVSTFRVLRTGSMCARGRANHFATGKMTCKSSRDQMRSQRR